MRRWVLALTLMGAVGGCTTYALERHSVNQIASVSDLRYKEVLGNLARLAADSAVLPAFAVTADGSVQLIDIGTLDAKSLWGHMFRGFISETLTGTASRNPQQQWTLDPVADEPKIKAQWYALLWVLRGPPPPCSEFADLLRKFQVDGELAKLPAGWLHIGCCKDVPKNACYHAHCHGTYVWVAPDGMAALSALTLVLLDIATVDLSSLEPFLPVASVARDKSVSGGKVTWEYTLDARLAANGTIEVGNFYGTGGGQCMASAPEQPVFIFSADDLTLPPPAAGPLRSLWNSLTSPPSTPPPPLPSPRIGPSRYVPAPRTTMSSAQLQSIINAARGGR